MAIRMKTTITGTIHGDGASHPLTKCSTRDVEFPIDEPIERGGTNTGPSPTETAIAALIGCTNVISNKCAEKLGIDIGHLQIEARYDFDRRGVLLTEEVDLPFPKVVLNIVSDGSATEAELQQVAVELAKYLSLIHI